MAGDPSDPIDTPDVVIADTGPLFSLARAGALNLLHEIGGTVVVVDVVRFEATRHLDKPRAAEIQRWIEEGSKPGSNRPVRVDRTTVGDLLEKAVQIDPDLKARDAGETAIADWLLAKVDSTFDRTIVIHENGKVGRMVADRGIDADIDVITTRAFLQLAERRGIIPSAQAVWDRIEDGSPTTNPRISGSFNRRMPAKELSPGASAPREDLATSLKDRAPMVRSLARAALLNEVQEGGARATTLAMISMVPLKDRNLVEQAAGLGARLKRDDLSQAETEMAFQIVKDAPPLEATAELVASLRRGGASPGYLVKMEAEVARSRLPRDP